MKFQTLFFLFLFTGGILSAQPGKPKLVYEQASLAFGYTHVLHFSPYSIAPTDTSEARLRAIGGLLTGQPAIIEDNVIVLQMSCCKEELAMKPYLPACRAQWVINYLHDNFRIPYNKCVILDLGPNEKDPKCLLGNTLTMYIKPAFR